MTVPDETSAVLRALEATGITYCLTGSLASTAWGRPRATYDADVLVALKRADVEALLAAFPTPAWYLDRESIVTALHAGGEFNAIHGATGSKVDFWQSARRPVDLVRLQRRRRATLAGVACWLLSPEDTILAKLEWMQASVSDRQLSDVAGVVALQGDNLDRDYLRTWADQLGVRARPEEALSGAWD